MAGGRFEKGNTASGKPRLWQAALRRAIAQSEVDRVRAAAEQLLDQAAAGEQWAIKELADRLDGKAVQAIEGADGESLFGKIQIVFGDNGEEKDSEG